MARRVVSAVRDLVASATIFSDTMRNVTDEILEEAGAGRVTSAQLKVLTLIAHTEGIGISEVATFLAVTPAAASKTVARLVDEGLVARTEAPTDRRMQQLSLTREGREILNRYENRFTDVLTDLFGKLPVAHLRSIASSLDGLSLLLVGETAGIGEDGCFRCGVYFRDRCLLRGSSDDRMCYRDVGRRTSRTAS